jgi:hypothetical protein
MVWACGGRLVAFVALAALWLVGSVPLSSPAAAANVCGDRGVIVKRLEERHQERRRALGLSSEGAVFEVLVAPDGGWTILVTSAEKEACIVAVGEAWQMIRLTGGERS